MVGKIWGACSSIPNYAKATSGMQHLFTVVYIA